MEDDQLLTNIQRQLEGTSIQAAVQLEETDEKEDSAWKSSLVGLIHSDCLIKISKFKESITRAWGLSGRVKISEYYGKSLLFQFEDPSSVERIWDKGPWCYNRDALILNRCVPYLQPEDYSFDHMEIWVQVHSIPFNCLTMSTAMKIGNILGTVIPIDPASVRQWSQYARFKVRINVHNPLKDKVCVILANQREVQASIKYERLPRFCHLCGRVGHELPNCNIRQTILKNMKDSSSEFFIKKMQELLLPKYSNSLRAKPISRVTRTRTNDDVLSGEDYDDSEIRKMKGDGSSLRVINGLASGEDNDVASVRRESDEVSIEVAPTLLLRADVEKSQLRSGNADFERFSKGSAAYGNFEISNPISINIPDTRDLNDSHHAEIIATDEGIGFQNDLDYLLLGDKDMGIVDANMDSADWSIAGDLGRFSNNLFNVPVTIRDLEPREKGGITFSAIENASHTSKGRVAKSSFRSNSLIPRGKHISNLHKKSKQRKSSQGIGSSRQKRKAQGLPTMFNEDVTVKSSHCDTASVLLRPRKKRITDVISDWVSPSNTDKLNHVSCSSVPTYEPAVATDAQLPPAK